jgi:hypothetical protein
LPGGWEGRLVRVQSAATDQSVGWCLEPHDLAASKLAAGREKDLEFVRNLLRHGFVDATTLGERVSGLPLPPERKRQLELWVDGQSGAPG